jgi:hypothetical protein
VKPSRQQVGSYKESRPVESSAVALLEFFLAAARARVIATDVLQGIAHGLLWRMAAVRAVNVAMIMVVVVMIVVVVVVVIVVAIRAVNVGFLVHQGCSGVNLPRIIP